MVLVVSTALLQGTGSRVHLLDRSTRQSGCSILKEGRGAKAYLNALQELTVTLAGSVLHVLSVWCDRRQGMGFLALFTMTRWILWTSLLVLDLDGVEGL